MNSWKLLLLISACFSMSCTFASGNAINGKDNFNIRNSEKPKVLELAASLHSTCAITTAGLTCWGQDKEFVNDTPQDLTAPRKLSSNDGDTFCVIADEGARCWGAGVEWFDNFSIVKNPVSKSGLSQLMITSGYYGLASTLPNPNGEGEVTYKNLRLFVWDEWFHEPRSSPFDDENIAISDIFASNYLYFAVINKEVWAFSHYSSWVPYKLTGLYNPAQVVSNSNSWVCGLMNGSVMCRDSEPSGGEAFTPDILRNINDFKKIAVASRYMDNEICGITSDRLVCWAKPRSAVNAVEAYSLPAGTFKNPTDLSVNMDSVCVIDDGNVRCWDKYFDDHHLLHLQNPYEPLKDFVGRKASNVSKVSCASVDQFKAPIGMTCVTNRGFRFERVFSGWKDTATGVTWNNEIAEENSTTFKPAEASCHKMGQMLPDWNDFVRAVRHGLYEALPDMVGKGFWFSAPKIDDGGVYPCGYSSSAECPKIKHFRCIK